MFVIKKFACISRECKGQLELKICWDISQEFSKFKNVANVTGIYSPVRKSMFKELGA